MLTGNQFMYKVILLFVVSLLIAAWPSLGKENTAYNKGYVIDNVQPSHSLRVASLNLAHGRKNSFSQFFLKDNTIKQNLDDVVQVLNKHRPQVVAFQEADFLEHFNHVNYIASRANYPWSAQASNMDFWTFIYGTALISSLPISETIEHTFPPSPPTFYKGFVLAEIEWPMAGQSSTGKVDVISVHLDFSRRSVRERQIKEMVEIISTRTNPVIIMGDFNSEWLKENSAIKKLLSTTQFTTHQPDSSDYNTYKNKRLDWILISQELGLLNYKILPDVLSDHKMVIADIYFKP